MLLTNDDGIDAPGLEALVVAAARFGRLRVVAPVGPHSGCGHRVTTHERIAVTPAGGDRLAVAGTPADCVRLALHHLVPDVSWVLAGINAGGNLGTDVYHSGTVAAVREAVINGRPGIALSQYIARGRPIDWPAAARRAAVGPRQAPRDSLGARDVLERQPPSSRSPAHPSRGSSFVPSTPRRFPLLISVADDHALYCGDYQQRARQPSSDVDICFRGQIAVTLIRLIPAANPSLFLTGEMPG